jgi:hypothetical protein
MRKIIALLALMGLMLAACGQQIGSPSNGGFSGGETLVVPNGTETMRLSLGEQFSALSRAAGDWEGVIQITGNGIDGTYTDLINRKKLDNGGFLNIILPLGTKHIEIEVNYDDGAAIHNYAGSTDATIVSGTNNVSIVLTKQNPGETIIDVTIREKVSISLREVGSSFPVENVAVTFKKGTDVVATVNTNVDGQVTVDLPVQATNEDAYTYQVDLYQYVRINGTIKVMLGKINLNGTVTSVMHLSHNLLKDVTQPVASGFATYMTSNNQPTAEIPIIGPNAVLPNAANAFYIRFTASDLNGLRTLTSSMGNVESLGGDAYRVMVPALPEGNHTLSVTLTDNAGNQRVVTYSFVCFMPNIGGV